MTTILDLIKANDKADTESRIAHNGDDFDAMIAASQRVHETAADIVRFSVGRKCSTGWINADGFGMSTGTAKVLGENGADIDATTDGGPIVHEWARKSLGVSVFAETWNTDGVRVWHGWIDSVSRKIVQSG